MNLENRQVGQKDMRPGPVTGKFASGKKKCKKNFKMYPDT